MIYTYFEKGIIILMASQVVIFRWLGISNYSGYCFDLLMFVHILMNYKKYNKKFLVVCFCFLVYFATSYIIFNGRLYDLVANLRDIFPPTLVLLFVSYLIKNKKEMMQIIFSKLFFPLNIYMVINEIVIYFQLKGYTWLSGIIRKKDFKFTYFVDSISGLFGMYGTVLLGLFSALVFIYNLYYAKFIKSEKNKYTLYIYNSVLALFNCYISSLNDNKLFYVFLFVFAVLYFFVNYYDLIVKNRKYIIPFIFLTLFILTCAYLFITPIHNAVNLMVKILISSLDYKNTYGSGERFGIVLHYLYEENKLFGIGLGNGRWTQEYILSFKHFGISDLGSILCLGGAILLALYIYIFGLFFKEVYKNKLFVLIMIFITLLMMFCTQIIHNFSAMILYIFINMILMFSKEEKQFSIDQ